MKPEVVAIFGLGEAGAAIASDLARLGLKVRAYDPAEVASPPGVTRFDAPADALAGAGLVMAITGGAEAPVAMGQAVPYLTHSTIYADLATTGPAQKQQLARTAADRGARFADVAVMAPVPGKGIAVPSLASGDGAREYSSIINSIGGNVELVGDEAGRAAARKLIRSIVTKGMAALIIESLELAEAHDETQWLWGHLLADLSTMDRSFLERLLIGTGAHAGRRTEEMMATAQLLAEKGVDPAMTRATITRLRRVFADGLPLSVSDSLEGDQ